jgi:hypothetical protein
MRGTSVVYIRKEISPGKVHFRIPKRRLIRQSILSALLMSIPVAAFFLDIDRQLQWFALGFSAVFVAFLFLMSALWSDEELEAVDPQSVHGRGTLIFLGIFWLALITGVGVLMYIRFPRP